MITTLTNEQYLQIAKEFKSEISINGKYYTGEITNKLLGTDIVYYFSISAFLTWENNKITWVTPVFWDFRIDDESSDAFDFETFIRILKEV